MEGKTGENERIVFQTDEGEVRFYVLEQTRVAGVNYILVTDSDEDEAECLILKDVSDEAGMEAVYEIVEDDQTLEALQKVFSERLEDTDIEM